MGLPRPCIPEDNLPQCWSDDVRMNALFAPFRIKTSNPESWEMKMKFWSDMLRQWCRTRKDPIVCAADAKIAFSRKGRTPACLDIVIEEMFRNGDLCPVAKYQQILHNGAEGWVKWGARLAFKPAAFALTAVASLLPARQALDNDGLPKPSIDSTQRFVLESAVKEQATELLQNYPPGLERIGTIEELMRNCSWQHGRDTFEMLLGYLVAQGAAVKKGDVVKLAEPEKKVAPVTETDEALAKLMGAETRLEGEVLRLTREAKTAEDDARAALKLGNKIAAKNHLRRKHKINHRLDKCTTALENVTHLLQQMRDVHVNVAIVDTYKSSSEAMKKNMKDNGLTGDTVLDTMDDLKEVMDEINEVEKALGTPVDDFDASELEDELKELLSTSGPAADTPQKDGTKLPSPPTARPSRKVSEREFVFDCEEQMLAELNQLDVEERALEERRERKEQRRPVPDVVELPDPEPATPPTNQSKVGGAWRAPSADRASDPGVWDEHRQIRQDTRIHPGQPLNVDFTTPPRLYNTDFQVRDHKMSAGVWLYNEKDSDLAASTEYFSAESPGKSTSTNFLMAPGGERKTHGDPWSPPDSTVEDLERRLKNLRGFNL